MVFDNFTIHLGITVIFMNAHFFKLCFLINLLLVFVMSFFVIKKTLIMFVKLKMSKIINTLDMFLINLYLIVVIRQ